MGGDGSSRFPVAPLGYNRQAVDEQFAELESELMELREALAQASHGEAPMSIQEELERIGEETASILVVAHDKAHETTRMAQEQAERCIADAAANAVSITEEATRKLAELEAETDGVRRRRERLIADVRNISGSLQSLADDAERRFADEQPPRGAEPERPRPRPRPRPSRRCTAPRAPSSDNVTMAIREHRPPTVLAAWLDCVWERTEDRGGGARILPDGCIDVVFSPSRGLRLIGANTVAFISDVEPGEPVIGARLLPGAAPALLGIAAEPVLDRRPPLSELLGDEGRRLQALLYESADRVATLRALADRAGARTRAPRTHWSPPPSRGWSATDHRVGPLADSLGVSERALRRRVTAAVGYGPKRLARVLRLRRALALAGDGSPLVDAAYEAGYADQAHFGHDCLELAGVAPGRFLQDAAALTVPSVTGMSNDITPLTLGWTIVYVEDPVAASAFYAGTFGLTPEFAAPDGSYAQLDTGQTKLAFASYALAESNFPGGVAPARPRPAAERRDHARHARRRRRDPRGARRGLHVARRTGRQAARPARRLPARSVRHADRDRHPDVAATGD